MAFNLFNKLYLSPDYLYDNSQTRILFSKVRNQAEYLHYDAMNHDGFQGKVLMSQDSVYKMIGDGKNQHDSIAHYLIHLHQQGVEGRIYADEESWNAIFFTWVLLVLPECTPEVAFRIYNFIKQREALVYPDNMAYRSFMDSRLKDRYTNSTLTKTEFLSAFASFIENDTSGVGYYDKVRASLKDDLCLEIQLASYFAGKTDINMIANKINRITSKVVYSVVLDIKDYIRDNIMTENVRSLTGITLSWDDQNWEQTLIDKSPEMAFLFSTDEETLLMGSDYRAANMSNAIQWCQWVVDHTDSSGGDDEWIDIYKGAQWVVNNQNVFSTDLTIRNSACETIIDRDVNFTGTTIIFQNEYLREKINTFWIEYVYQMAKANDIEGLIQISRG